MKNEKNVDLGIYYVPIKIVENILKGYPYEKNNIYNVISNLKRQEIIRFCYHKKRTITEIQKHLNLSYNPTWKHIQLLIEKSLVTGTPTIDKKGAVVYIETIKGYKPIKNVKG